jgi:small-conductance mechanosensitive channel
MSVHDLLPDWLSAFGGLSTPEQLAATAILGTLVIATITGARHLRTRAEAAYVPPVITVLTVTVLGLLGVAFVSVWDAWDPLTDAVGDLGARQRLPEIAITVPILIVAHVVSTLAKEAIQSVLGERDAVTAHQRQTSYRLTQLLVWTTALVVVLGLWEINLGGLLIGAGFLGIVIGMAARQTLGNVLAGFVLMFARPFEIGEWVAIGDDEGIVTDITILNTRLRTFHGEYVVVPNSMVRDAHVTNRSRRGRLLVEVEVGVDYDAELDHVVETTAEAITGLDPILDTPDPSVSRKRFADSSIVLGAWAWIDSPTADRRYQARSAMIDAIVEAYDREDITVPFPQRTIGSREGGPAQQLGVSGPQPSESRGDGE